MENNIRSLRKAAGLTQEDLAQALGVTRQTINVIENDKYDPTLGLAMRLARFLNTPVEDIFRLPGALRQGLPLPQGFFMDFSKNCARIFQFLRLY